MINFTINLIADVKLTVVFKYYEAKKLTVVFEYYEAKKTYSRV